MGDELNRFLERTHWPRYADGMPVYVGDVVCDDRADEADGDEAGGKTREPYWWTVDGIGIDERWVYLFDGNNLTHRYKFGEAVHCG